MASEDLKEMKEHVESFEKRKEFYASKEDINVLRDLLEQALIATRDSTPKSLSDYLFRMERKLDNHIRNHETEAKEIKEKLDPVFSAFQKASGFKAVVILLAITVGSLVTIIEGWRVLFKK
jgi:uncharacterized membrane protein (DUF106 family)